MDQIGPVAQIAASQALSTGSPASSTVATSEHAAAARILLGSYRKGEADDPDVYVAQIVRVFAGYPAEVALRVARSLPERIKWLPNVAEVKSACEEDYGPVRRTMEYDLRSREQLAEHRRLEEEGESLERRQEVAGRVLADWAGRVEPVQKRAPETVEQMLERYGVSRAAFDALPDLPARVADKNPERLDRR